MIGSEENSFSPFPAPPEAPTLSAFPLSSSSSDSYSSASSGDLLRAGHSIDQMIESLARAVPSKAEKFGSIKNALRGLIAECVQQHSSGGQSSLNAPSGPAPNLPPTAGGVGKPY